MDLDPEHAIKKLIFCQKRLKPGSRSIYLNLVKLYEHGSDLNQIWILK